MLDNRKMSIAIQQLSHINLPLVRSVASSIERGSETKIQNLRILFVFIYGRARAPICTSLVLLPY